MTQEKSICHITFSTSGGAGVVAKRLQEGQSAAGLESRLLSMTGRDIKALVFYDPLLVGRALTDFYGIRKSRNSHLYSLLRNSSSRSIRKEIQNSDEIIHLHWTPGVVSLDDIAKYSRNGSPIVWTLHDMWAFTGGCHHSMECNQYEIGCPNCPQARNIFRGEVKNAAEQKRQIFESPTNIHFVSPSQWLANKAITSYVMSKAKLHVIPNPVDCNVFKPRIRPKRSAEFGINENAFVVGCSSMDLTDPMKNMRQLLIGMKEFAAIAKEREIVLLAVGGGELSGEGFQISLTGHIESQVKMASTYQAMDVFVSLSLAENFPLTIAEATAAGVPVICLNNGGMPEIVIDGITGRVIDDESQLVGVLLDFISDTPALQKMSNNSRRHAVQSFSLESVLQKYDRIYDEVGK